MEENRRKNFTSASETNFSKEFASTDTKGQGGIRGGKKKMEGAKRQIKPLHMLKCSMPGYLLAYFI